MYFVIYIVDYTLEYIAIYNVFVITKYIYTMIILVIYVVRCIAIYNVFVITKYIYTMIVLVIYNVLYITKYHNVYCKIHLHSNTPYIYYITSSHTCCITLYTYDVIHDVMYYM